jgi:uncharacterized protein (DUF983 family)
MSKLWRHINAIVRQRCPRCLEGRAFRGSVTMNETCPICGLRFEREQGYFMGAMYVSYLLASVVLGFLMVLIHWLFVPDWKLEYALLLAAPPFLLMVPMLFRYSRVVWMHFDRWADPTPEPGTPPLPPGGQARRLN